METPKHIPQARVSNRWQDLLHKYLLSVGVIVGLLGVLVIANLPQLSRDFRLATTHQPEPLTELYFPASQLLMHSYRSGQQFAITFAIHNLEYKKMTYRYRVSAQTSAGTVSLDGGSIPANTNQTVTVEAPITISSTDPRIAVTVTLPDSHEAIHYWLERV